MRRLTVLSESGTESILEAAASPSITEHRSFAAGRNNMSPIVCAFPALAIRNATRYEATVAFPFNLTKSSKKNSYLERFEVFSGKIQEIFLLPQHAWFQVKSSHLYLYSAFNNTNCNKALLSRCRRSFAGLMLSLAKIS